MRVSPNHSRLFALALTPALLLQARQLRRRIPLLPDAARPWTGSVEGDNPLRLLVLGDSTAAGVGAATQADALPGNLARSLAAEWDRGASWEAIGRNGATSGDIVREYLDAATALSHDLVFLSIGANDALTLRSRGAFRRDLRTILRRLRAANPHALILVSSLPAWYRFDSLPNPLRWVLYLHSQSLEAAARLVVAGEPGVLMSPPPPPYTPDFFATDRFHPSASGYRDWVEFALTDSLLLPPRETGATA